jgi:hypothetical protein
LKESVVYDIAFAIFAVDDPLALLHMAKAGVGGDGAGSVALFCVYKKRSAGTKSAHRIGMPPPDFRLFQ